MVQLFSFVLTGMLALAYAGAAFASPTLMEIKKRGELICGVNEGLRGFSLATSTGWVGFDVDICRAVAAAVFGDTDRIKYVPLNVTERFEALRSSRIDVLSRNSTWTMSREVDLDLVFPAVTYFDGQGFMIRKTHPATSPLELGDAKICVQSNTTTSQNLDDYIKENGMRVSPVLFEGRTEALQAYRARLCDVFTSDISELHADRLELGKSQDHIILPDIISKEPLGPAIRKGDEQWADIVKWTVFALINAEELGISERTIDQFKESNRPEIRRLLGKDGRNYAERLGLAADWAGRIIRLVGNYGDIFDRNLGANSTLSIPRRLNRLWNAGGILYAPPIR
jgi:general L-amino acid transport system substrate-binding protein